MAEKNSIVDNKYFYEFKDRNGNNERTKKRLQQIEEMGLVEVGEAHFGIIGIMSGLYIERVWGMNEEDWNDCLNWIKELITQKTK